MTKNEQSETMPQVPEMPENLALAMAYVPFQQFRELYTPEEALMNGTLFSELNKPFERGAK